VIEGSRRASEVKRGCLPRSIGAASGSRRHLRGALLWGRGVPLPRRFGRPDNGSNGCCPVAAGRRAVRQQLLPRTAAVRQSPTRVYKIDELTATRSTINPSTKIITHDHPPDEDHGGPLRTLWMDLRIRRLGVRIPPGAPAFPLVIPLLPTVIAARRLPSEVIGSRSGSQCPAGAALT
jgi:hypothetical protein